VACIGHALEALELPPVPAEQIRRTIGLGLLETLEILTGVTDPGIQGSFRKYFVERADEVMVSQTDLLDGVVPTLDTLLGAGLDLGIVSTKYAYRIDATLLRHGIEDRFRSVVGGNDVESLKPAPDGLHIALERLGVTSDRALYVGDHVVDAQAAHSAGISFIGVLTGSTSPEDFRNYPHLAILGSVAELPGFLSTLKVTGP